MVISGVIIIVFWKELGDYGPTARSFSFQLEGAGSDSSDHTLSPCGRYSCGRLSIRLCSRGERTWIDYSAFYVQLDEMAVAAD